ncbi:hypothetical protein YPPY72_2246, partial [Yersinia pestis PY-72]
MNIGGVDRHIK